MKRVAYNGWKNNVRLANADVELIVTTDVGPRIIRFGFIGEDNVFTEMPGQQGGAGEKQWMIRGGHRFWIAPEEAPKTYELDNAPVRVEEIPGGVRTLQAPGPLSGIAKTMEITLSPDTNRARIVHTLTNASSKPATLAPWALSVMKAGGMAIIPLPRKIPHTDRLTHNQEWSLWGYTDFSDPRWSLGGRYIFFRHDAARGPNKLGIAHREGWVGYQLGPYLFVKRFAWTAGAVYPDGGVNFETFANEDFLEIESLGALVTLAPGDTTTHVEEWSLHRNPAGCAGEDDADTHVRPRAEK